MHFLHTYPELSFAIGKVCQYSAELQTNYQTIVVRILYYIKLTVDYEIEYRAKQESTKVVGYSDSDYASDKRDRKSTLGYTFMLGEEAIIWSSQKIKSIVISMTEAEYMGLRYMIKYTIQIRRVLVNTQQDKGEITILGDNKPSLNLIQNLG